MDGKPRCGIVDLGSNSVRLVIYEGINRNPLVIFNEKAVLRLGEGLHTTGSLQPDKIAHALLIIRRFGAIARALDATPLEVVATAAVRDAKNGEDFVSKIQEILPEAIIRILSGREEAELSAVGLYCGIPTA